MNLLITGTPGSGKTSLVAYAEESDDKRFVDADVISGLCEWREFDGGKVIGLADDITVTGGDGWYKKHGWFWRIERLKQFLIVHPNAIICGSSENIADCYKLFDQILILRKTQDELLSNLQSPDRLNPFGKTNQQRAGFMMWQDYLIKQARPYNSRIIDGNNIATTYQRILELS